MSTIGCRTRLHIDVGGIDSQTRSNTIAGMCSGRQGQPNPSRKVAMPLEELIMGDVVADRPGCLVSEGTIDLWDDELVERSEGISQAGRALFDLFRFRSEIDSLVGFYQSAHCRAVP